MWENNVPSVVMLTKLVENGKVKDQISGGGGGGGGGGG